MSVMRISQLAERSGVPATTLRFYEDARLLPADRTPSGYRVYGDDAVERLAFIGAGKRLGLALDEIGELLAVWESGACREVRARLRPRVVGRLAQAGEQIRELQAFCASLRAALELLDALPERTARCDSRCGFRPSPEPQAGGREPERWRTAAVACSLSGAGMAERAAAWHGVLAGAARTVIPDGVRLTVLAGRAVEVAGLAAAEQQCCPFFDFRLHLDGPDLHVEVRAPADGAALLGELFGPVA